MFALRACIKDMLHKNCFTALPQGGLKYMHTLIVIAALVIVVLSMSFQAGQKQAETVLHLG